MRPIIIISPGRSGSTLFHSIIAKHPSTAWFSHLAHIFPNRFIFHKLIWKLDHTPLSNLIRTFVKPAEAYNLWEQVVPGFSRPCRDLTKEDLTLKSKRQAQNLFKKIASDKTLVIKITGWPRVDLLRELFPEGKIIHIVRDGRATVNSFLNVYFWEGWSGPSNWRFGKLPKKYSMEWFKYNKSFVALASIQLKMYFDSWEKNKPKEFLQIKYEDICKNPTKTFNRTLEYCELPKNHRFAKYVTSLNLTNKNHKWTTDLTKQQQQILNQSLAPILKKYDYK